MRQIGRKCRAFLFYVLTDCITLHTSSEAAQAAQLRQRPNFGRLLPDSRNHYLFWALLEDFKGAIAFKKAVREYGTALDSEFLKTYLPRCKIHFSAKDGLYIFVSAEPEMVIEYH